MPDFKELERLHRLCQLRSTLEAFAVAHLRRGGEWSHVTARLRGHLPELKKWATRGDYERFYQADMELHRRLVQSLDLPALHKSWESVVKDLDEWIVSVDRTYWTGLVSLYREHIYLIEAWESISDEVAEQATHQHLESGWYRIAATEGKFISEMSPVDRVTSFVATHYASHLDVEWLASNVGFVSASHLTRLFRTELGLSPYAYLKRTRMEQAAALLRAGPDEIHQVAQRCGYGNVSHFIRDFRQYYKKTPRHFRAVKS